MIYLRYDNVSSYEVLYWKSISMMIMNYFFVRGFGVFVMDIPRKYHRLIVFRAIFGFMGIQGMFSSVKYLPVSTASSIFFTVPIWSAIFARLFIKESITVYDYISLLTAFTGVLVINNPWQESAPAVSINEGLEGNFIDKKVYTTSDKIIGTSYALVGAITCAAAFLCMRTMRSDIHYSVPPFWFSIGGTFLSPIFSI